MADDGLFGRTVEHNNEPSSCVLRSKENRLYKYSSSKTGNSRKSFAKGEMFMFSSFV